MGLSPSNNCPLVLKNSLQVIISEHQYHRFRKCRKIRQTRQSIGEVNLANDLVAENELKNRLCSNSMTCHYLGSLKANRV